MYSSVAMPSCRMFERQAVLLAASLAWAKTGKRIAAKIAMIAMTTRSSIRVKALGMRVREWRSPIDARQKCEVRGLENAEAFGFLEGKKPLLHRGALSVILVVAI